MKDLVVVPQPRCSRIWVCWADGAWSEFDLAGGQLNAYPPLDDSVLKEWALKVAEVKRRDGGSEQ